jgi:aspartyl protease family protein
MRQVILFAVMALVIAGLVPRLYVNGNGPAAEVAKAMPAEPAPAQSSYRSMTIPRGDHGHFSVEATIDGRRMDFVVDTGASAVVLRERDAARLGIHPSERDYTGRTQTANGVARYAPVELNRVDVGGIVVYNVRAAVMPDEALGQNLLGMTFLSKVRWEHKNGRLVIEQ